MLKFETVLSTSFYFKKDNLLFVKIKEDPDLTIQNTIINNEQTHATLGEIICKVILDVRHLQFTHIPREVLNYVADSPYGKYQLAEAILISGLGQKLIANFYLKVIKPKVNSKIFTSLLSALEWHDIENKNYYISMFKENT